jgi:DNA-binding Lrp family transcriptional regulator
VNMGWRKVLKVHPACELFPLLPPDELHELADDIKANGLRDKIKVVKQHRKRPDGSFSVDDYDWIVVDGRNRLDAMELAGLPIFKADNKPNFSNFYNVELERDTEIRAYVISVNIHRRHLSPEKRVELLREVIKDSPAKSDRRIASTTGFSHTKVSQERKKLEELGDVATVATRTDTRGREQPAHRPRPSVPPSGAPAPAPPAIRKFTPGETLADIVWTIEALVRSIADVEPAEVVAELGPTALIELARNAELGSAWLGALQVLAACAAKGAPNHPAGNGSAPLPQLDLFLRGSGTPVIHVDVADGRHGG